MAKYDYNALKIAATNGSRIGGWQGYDVYACSKYKYKPGLPHFYVIYDDSNKLVRAGYVYGSISSSGEVSELRSPIKWVPPTPKGEPAEKKVPASAYSAFVAGAKPGDTEVKVSTEDFFVRIDREINELLANASKVDLTVHFGEDV
jgi:hypothetical protein